MKTSPTDSTSTTTIEPKKKRRKPYPLANRTRTAFTELGYRCELAERIYQRPGLPPLKFDFCNFGDHLCWHPEKPEWGIAVLQTCDANGGAYAEHRRKILDNVCAWEWVRMGWKIALVGWKRPPKGRSDWAHRIEWLKVSDFETSPERSAAFAAQSAKREVWLNGKDPSRLPKPEAVTLFNGKDQP